MPRAQRKELNLNPPVVVYASRARSRSIESINLRTERRLIILNILRDALPEGRRSEDIADLLGIPNQMAANDMRLLRDLGMVTSSSAVTDRHANGVARWFATEGEEDEPSEQEEREMIAKGRGHSMKVVDLHPLCVEQIEWAKKVLSRPRADPCRTQ
jgi:DNA-binding Lrp family transcriptional regulator